ncbi:MAG: OmpA family protein [Deltaproteobacteria bacterium]|nr:OmpA family protein [Deltaproteobacteria bacterium]
MKKNSKDSEEKAGKWLGTFNDMVTLLLTFFVLVLSMSKLDVARVNEAVYAINDAFGMLSSAEMGDIKAFEPFIIPIRNRRSSFSEKKRELAEHIDKMGNMDAKVIEGGVSIILKEKLFFKTGMSEIEEKNYPSLKNLSSILQKTDCQIRVEGHTDDVPIENKRFPSNWELSVARAVNVVKYFISKGNISPERLSAAGYGDSKPLYPNVSDHNRELNRRVGIILTLIREFNG